MGTGSTGSFEKNLFNEDGTTNFQAWSNLGAAVVQGFQDGLKDAMGIWTTAEIRDIRELIVADVTAGRIEELLSLLEKSQKESTPQTRKAKETLEALRDFCRKL